MDSRIAVVAGILLSALLAGCLDDDDIGLKPVEAPQWAPGQVQVYETTMGGEMSISSQQGDHGPLEHTMDMDVPDFRLVEEVLATGLEVDGESAYLVASAVESDEPRAVTEFLELEPVNFFAVRADDHTWAEVTLAQGSCSSSCPLGEDVQVDAFDEHPLFDFPLAYGKSWIAQEVPERFVTEPNDGAMAGEGTTVRTEPGVRVEAKVSATKHLDHDVVGKTSAVVVDYTATFTGLEALEQEMRSMMAAYGVEVERFEMSFDWSYKTVYGVEPGVVLAMEDVQMRGDMDMVVIGPDGMRIHDQIEMVYEMDMQLVEYGTEEGPQRGADYLRALKDGLLAVGVSATGVEPPAYEVGIVPDREKFVGGEGEVLFELESTGAPIPEPYAVEWDLTASGEEVATSRVSSSQGTDFSHAFDASGIHMLNATVVGVEGESVARTQMLVPVDLESTKSVSCPVISAELLDMLCPGHDFPVREGAAELTTSADSDAVAPGSAQVIVFDAGGAQVTSGDLGETLVVDGSSLEETGQWSVQVVHEYGVMEGVDYSVQVTYESNMSASTDEGDGSTPYSGGWGPSSFPETSWSDPRSFVADGLTRLLEAIS